MNVITFSSDSQKENTAFEGPWITECPKEELLECYSDWEPEVQSLLQVSLHIPLENVEIYLMQCIEKPTKWALHQLRPLPTYVSTNIALVGDSVRGTYKYLPSF